MCVVASNLEHLFALHKGVIEAGATMEETLVVDESVKKWSFEMVEGATAAAVKIQAGTGLSLGGTALAALGGVGPSSSANEDDEGTEVEAASKWMETVSTYETTFPWFGGLPAIINLNWLLLVLIILLHGNKPDSLLCDC